MCVVYWCEVIPFALADETPRASTLSFITSSFLSVSVFFVLVFLIKLLTQIIWKNSKSNQRMICKQISAQMH